MKPVEVGLPLPKTSAQLVVSFHPDDGLGWTVK